VHDRGLHQQSGESEAAAIVIVATSMQILPVKVLQSYCKRLSYAGFFWFFFCRSRKEHSCTITGYKNVYLFQLVPYQKTRTHQAVRPRFI